MKLALLGGFLGAVTGALFALALILMMPPTDGDPIAKSLGFILLCALMFGGLFAAAATDKI